MRIPFCTHRFQVSGLNLERFLNLMKLNDIPLLRVYRPNRRALLCECYSGDLAEIAALAGEKGWKLEEAAPLGLSAFAIRMKKRPGIPVGIALMLVCILALSPYIWRVDVQGAGAYEADIVSFLQENGYSIGIRRTSVDAKALESALSYRYPQISWFYVYVTNMTLVVEVYEGVPMPEMQDGTTGDLIAERDGIIQSVQVFAGTPAVEPGDVVRKGDVLIRGTERSRDEQQTLVHADGMVMARCWDSFTVHMPVREIISSETGREHRAFRIHTPWFSWPAAADEPDFLASNLSITRTPVAGAFFPVFMDNLLYREVSMETRIRDEQEIRREAGEAALEKLKTALFHNEIIDKWVDYCMIEDDILAATATAERLVDIGVFSSP